MSGEDKAETRLRELLRDPRWSLPSGPDPEQRVRRAAQRQRLRLAGMAGVAAAALIVVAIPGGLGVLGHLSGPQQPPAAPTLYVYSSGVGSNHAKVVTPVNTATGTPGKPIHVGVGGSPWPGGMVVITADGKTAYVATEPGLITPINTATGTLGKPIRIRKANNGPYFIAITPDGKTVYVAERGANPATVTPVSTATGTPGKPINIRGGFPTYGQIVITPDGKTAYVTTWSGTIIPIDTATGTRGKPIRVRGGAFGIAITPDGKTAYVTSQSGCRIADHRCTYTVTPISTATNTPGKPIPIGSGPDTFTPEIVITPDGKTAYVTRASGVTPINTATGTPGKPIHVVGTPFSHAIAITP